MLDWLVGWLMGCMLDHVSEKKLYISPICGILWDTRFCSSIGLRLSFNKVGVLRPESFVRFFFLFSYRALHFPFWGGRSCAIIRGCSQNGAANSLAEIEKHPVNKAFFFAFFRVVFVCFVCVFICFSSWREGWGSSCTSPPPPPPLI